jgi:hypothetical protein
MKFRDKFGGLVGPGLYRHALFYNFAGGLRFELSEGGSPLDQVLTALGKASAICADVFAQETSIHVHLQKYCPSSRFQLRHTLRELALAGLSIPRCREIWVAQLPTEEQDEGDDEGAWINLAFEVPKAKLQNLLWCAFASDFESLHPNPHCLVYLLNPEQGIIVHPYDDRGMDIIGGKRVPLQKLYDAHKAWLLDYDIDTMDRTFSNPP